jgi:hypothetical protein
MPCVYSECAFGEVGYGAIRFFFSVSSTCMCACAKRADKPSSFHMMHSCTHPRAHSCMQINNSLCAFIFPEVPIHFPIDVPAHANLNFFHTKIRERVCFMCARWFRKSYGMTLLYDVRTCVQWMQVYLLFLHNIARFCDDERILHLDVCISAIVRAFCIQSCVFPRSEAVHYVLLDDDTYSFLTYSSVPEAFFF